MDREAVPALSKVYVIIICREKKFSIFTIRLKRRLSEEEKNIKNQGLLAGCFILLHLLGKLSIFVFNSKHILCFNSLTYLAMYMLI